MYLHQKARKNYKGVKCIECNSDVSIGSKRGFCRKHCPKMKHNEFSKKKLRISKMGKNNPMYGLKFSEETRKKMSDSQKGSKSHAWRGGITPIHRAIRRSLEYRLWREAVFKRDNWTCVWCGQKGIKLNADHIKPFSAFPELRFALDNGRTLCVPCHKTTDTFGARTKNVFA